MINEINSYTSRKYSSWWDKALGTFWPHKRFINAHFRRMTHDEDYRNAVFMGLRLRGYRAAKSTGHNTPFFGSNKTADAEIVGDLPKLISRSRELNRDDPIAGGLTNTFTNNVIGPGMVPQARTDDKEKNKRIERAFNRRKDHLHPVEQMTYGESQRLKFRKVFEDGNFFIKWSVRDPGDFMFLELIEKDRVRTPIGMAYKLEKGHKIVDGVEKDQIDVPVAYWITTKRTPVIGTGTVSNQATPVSKPRFFRVPADQIKHLKISERAGQTHGVPKFHNILQDLRDLDLLILASLKRSQIAACLAAFLTTDTTMGNIADLTAQKYGFKLDQALEPGMIYKLNPGEKIETLIPNFPVPELESFIIMLARRIGAALGVTWQIVLKDFSKANYSSARTDLLEARQGYSAFQKWFIDKYLNWEWFTVLSDAQMKGDPDLQNVSTEDLTKVHWIPPGWRWVDPVREAKATEIELKIGATTLRDICASQGKDWEENMEQLKIEQDKREELGLKPTVPPAGAGRPMGVTQMIQDKDGIFKAMEDLRDDIDDLKDGLE